MGQMWRERMQEMEIVSLIAEIWAVTGGWRGVGWVLTCETITHYISIEFNASNLGVMRGCVLSGGSGRRVVWVVTSLRMLVLV